jgi:hypothetical protein
VLPVNYFTINITADVETNMVVVYEHFPLGENLTSGEIGTRLDLM